MSFLNVVIEAHDHIVATSSLPSRQHAANAHSTDDLLSLLSLFKRHTLHTLTHNIGKYFGNVRVDRGILCMALEVHFVEYRGNSGLVLTAISMELRLVLIGGSFHAIDSRNNYE